MPNSRCQNCGHSLIFGDKFCSACGQSANTHRLSFKHFLHELFHAITHTDKGILYLLKGLATKPGIVAREYIDGKRKKYFNPFTFLLIIMAVFAISGQFFDSRKIENEIPTSIQRVPDPVAREKAIAMYQRGKQVREFTSKKASLISLVAIPVIAFVFWIAYKRNRFNYSEHLTAVLMFTAFANLIFGLLVFPLQKILHGSTGILIGFILQSIYFSWSYMQLTAARTMGKKLKAVMVSSLVIIIWFLFSSSLMAIYIYRSWSFYQFFVRMGG